MMPLPPEEYGPDASREGALYHRLLPDGYEITVFRMTFGKVRLCLGEQGPSGGICNAYCYQSLARVLEAAACWDGQSDPLDGWIRNPLTGRRRDGGDPNKEYVYP